MTAHFVVNKPTDDKSIACVGFFYNYDGTANDLASAIIFEKYPNSYTNMYFGAINNTSGNYKVIQRFNTNNSLKLPINIFDGAEHRISIWLEPTDNNNTFNIKVRADDDNRIFKYEQIQITNNNISMNIQDGQYAGFFVCNSDSVGIVKSQVNVSLKELYFVNWPTKSAQDFKGVPGLKSVL
jgi:hypothetical protein